MRASIVGAGVAGLSCAVELAERGVAVEVLERAAGPGPQACSWYAGGMLAPGCERETAEALVTELGEEGLRWWRSHFPATVCNGSLVVAPGRDTAELARFARRTEGGTHVHAAGVAELEPELAERFNEALFFADEAHLDPRAALDFLTTRLRELGGRVRFDAQAAAEARLGEADADHPVIVCTGLAARSALPDLRGVKGEMLVLRSPELVLHRPVRLLHPRLPVYVVPRGEGVYMVGATMIESDDAGRITARSMLELLSAAYALHPAFGEAEIVEVGTQVRAAFPDNLPRIRRRGGVVHVNGLYRHGFLLAPALARRVADHLLNDAQYPEVIDANHGERRIA